jgi:hypothetical protein
MGTLSHLPPRPAPRPAPRLARRLPSHLARLASRALTSGVLASCAYRPGSFVEGSAGFPGQRATVGCVDVAVERRADLPTGPVLGYHFANRCDHAAVIDLGALAVVGRTASGADLPLRPYDPRAELRPVALDGRNTGAEALAYAAGAAVSQVCVDVATLGPRAPARWLCFGASPAVNPGTLGRLP